MLLLTGELTTRRPSGVLGIGVRIAYRYEPSQQHPARRRETPCGLVDLG
jgi:hypothetical protein